MFWLGFSCGYAVGVKYKKPEGFVCCVCVWVRKGVCVFFLLHAHGDVCVFFFCLSARVQVESDKNKEEEEDNREKKRKRKKGFCALLFFLFPFGLGGFSFVCERVTL